MTAPKQQKLFSIERRAQQAGLAVDAAPAAIHAPVADVPAPVAVSDPGYDRILEELAALRAEVAALHAENAELDAEQDDMRRDVRVEIAQMVRSIGKAKTQIAAIKNPVVGRDEMEKASLQLEEITKSTEDATNEIMSATDEVEQLLKRIHAQTVDDPDVAPLIDEASERLIAIIEACAFQDLTGQRVTQVVKTLRYIESRVLAMIDIWGLEAFQDIDIPLDENDEDAAGESDEDELLNGPALAGAGLSQADIDALFD